MLSTAIDTLFPLEFGYSETLRVEEPPMTMQVGMIGNDGIILAGDVWTHINVNTAMVPPERLVWAAEARSKITIFSDGNLAVSRAFDMRQAKSVSDAIGAELTSEYWNDPEKRIEDIANSALESESEWRGIQCLIAIKTPLSLFKLECLKDPIAQKNRCDCYRSAGHVFAGDGHNPATFWATRYLADATKDWAIDKLLPLAVQIVIDAGQINNGSIRNLELVYCDESGFHRLPVPDSRAWAIEATKRGTSIADLITAPLPGFSSGQ